MLTIGRSPLPVHVAMTITEIAPSPPLDACFLPFDRVSPRNETLKKDQDGVDAYATTSLIEIEGSILD